MWCLLTSFAFVHDSSDRSQAQSHDFGVSPSHHHVKCFLYLLSPMKYSVLSVSFREKKKVYLHQNTAPPINRHRPLQCKCSREIWVVMMADIFPSKEKSEGLQVQSAVLTRPYSNCTRAVGALYQEKWSSCATWCLSAASCPRWASSWLMWCPAVIAGPVRSQTWTSSRECCVTVAPFMTDRVSLALLRRVLARSPLPVPLLLTCVTLTLTPPSLWRWMPSVEPATV